MTNTQNVQIMFVVNIIPGRNFIRHRQTTFKVYGNKYSTYFSTMLRKIHYDVMQHLVFLTAQRKNFQNF